MNIANIATAKNQFSRLIEQVKQGETIVITDRNRPVARLQPLEDAEPSIAALIASGAISPPQRKLDLKGFLAAKKPTMKAGSALSRAIVEEREDSR